VALFEGDHASQCVFLIKEADFAQDMTNFLPLFKEDQTIIFDLGNLVNDVFTAPFNITLTSSYFTVDRNSSPPADVILPLSKRQGAAGQPSYF
jgi:hypothetical protein